MNLRLVGGSDATTHRTGGREADAVIRVEVVVRHENGVASGSIPCHTPGMSQQAPVLPGTDAAPLPSLPDWEIDLRRRLDQSDLHVRKSLGAASDFALFVTSGARPLVAADLTRGNLLRWATGLVIPDKPGSRKTAQNKVSQLRSFCDYLVLAGSLLTNPLDKLRMPSARGRRAGAVHFTAEQVSDLMAAAKQRAGKLKADGTPDLRAAKEGPLSETFYGFLTWTGLRYSEAGTQLWEDVNLAEAWIVLTKDKARRNDKIPLSREAVAALRQWRVYSRGDLIFPKRPSHHTLLLDMETCGIDGWQVGTDKAVKGQWHRFRKCAVRERAMRGADVRSLKNFARHSDVNVTLNAYDHAAVEELRPTAELMPLLNGFLDAELQPGGNAKKKKRADSPVAAPAESRYITPVTVSQGTLMPSLTRNPEPHANARANGIGPDCDKQRSSSARAFVQGSESEQWSRGEFTSRLDSERLATVNKALDIAAEALRQLRGPLVALCLMLGGSHKPASLPDVPAPVVEAAPRERTQPVFVREIPEQ